MKITDPATGHSLIQKRRRRFAIAGQPRELTFSCFRRIPFLGQEATCQWLRDALLEACEKTGYQIWAYVFMPEHVHLLVYPGDAPERMPAFLRAVKEPVARQVLAHLRRHSPQWLERLAVREGQRLRHRVWQPGGGYDRNVTDTRTLPAMIDYLHANPVRRGLVARPEDWRWSSAQWFAGLRPVPLEMAQYVLIELARN